MNILLPDQIQTFVMQQANAAGFDSTDAYIYHLVLREQARVTQQARVESMLMDGLDSGEPLEATNDWWEQKRSRLSSGLQRPEA